MSDSTVEQATPIRLIGSDRVGDEPASSAPAGEHRLRLEAWAIRPDRDAAAGELSVFNQALIDETGNGLQLAEADLAGLDLSGFDLRQATLNRARLHGTDFSGADLEGAALICPGMERTRFTGANLAGAYVHALAAQVCDFREADLSRLVDATGFLFHGCVMSGVRLDGAALAGSAFYQCNLTGARFERANLQGATINECLLDGTDFEAAHLSQCTVIKSRMAGASLHRASGEGTVLQRLTGADGLCLEDADLARLRLDGVTAKGLRARHLKAPEADFHDCAFPEADLAGAGLQRARISACHLPRANLAGAKLEATHWTDSSVREAVFREAMAENLSAIECAFPGADMRAFGGRTANFRDCDLSGADLAGAYLYRAMLTGDPPASMALVGAKLDGAVLVQAYLAADLIDATMHGAKCAYARLNQCVLKRADLAGIHLFEAGMVKTDFTDAKVVGLAPPFFADRAPGLRQALEAAGEGEGPSATDFLDDLEALLAGRSRGST